MPPVNKLSPSGFADRRRVAATMVVLASAGLVFTTVRTKVQHAAEAVRKLIPATSQTRSPASLLPFLIRTLNAANARMQSASLRADDVCHTHFHADYMGDMAVVWGSNFKARTGLLCNSAILPTNDRPPAGGIAPLRTRPVAGILNSARSDPPDAFVTENSIR